MTSACSRSAAWGLAQELLLACRRRRARIRIVGPVHRRRGGGGCRRGCAGRPRPSSTSTRALGLEVARHAPSDAPGVAGPRDLGVGRSRARGGRARGGRVGAHASGAARRQTSSTGSAARRPARSSWPTPTSERQWPRSTSGGRRRRSTSASGASRRASGKSSPCSPRAPGPPRWLSPLGVSVATVQAHVKSVLRKFGVHSKVEAVRWHGVPAKPRGCPSGRERARGSLRGRWPRPWKSHWSEGIR